MAEKGRRRVKAGEPVVELETDKVDLEVPAEKDGVLGKIARQAGDDVQIGDVLGGDRGGARAAGQRSCRAPKAGRTCREEPAASPHRQSMPQPRQLSEDERATPVAKRMAAEQGVDLAAVRRRWPGGA